MEKKISLILEYLKKEPIEETKTFKWHATPIGISASGTSSNNKSNDLLFELALSEGKLISLDLSREEHEYHHIDGLHIIIFYS